MSNDPKVNMPNYQQYGEAMYSTPKRAEQLDVPQQDWGQYADEVVAKKSPVLFVGLGLAAGALIGATLFLAFSPSSVKEKTVEMKAEAPAPAPAPVVVAAPLPAAVVPPPPPVAVVAPPPPPVAVVEAPPPPPPPAPTVVASLPTRPALPPAELVLPRSEILNLLSKARTAISEGDISQARAYLERAAKTNDAIALLMLGETYDPETLKNMGARGIRADIARAKALYEKSVLFGEPQAKIRLEGLR